MKTENTGGDGGHTQRGDREKDSGTGTGTVIKQEGKPESVSVFTNERQESRMEQE